MLKTFSLAMLTATGDPTDNLMSFLPSILMLVAAIAIVYFFMIRPQRKREKKSTEMRNSIEIGDEVTTIGGLVGRVVSLKDDTFILETAGERSRMRFKRWAISEVGKLTIDTAEPEATIKE